MKRGVVLIVMLGCSFVVSAQDPITEIIKAGIKKIIKAVDLKIQRKQNETIWLQHAQKEIENVLHATKLKEIGDRASKQKELYANYFDELMQVKSVIAQAGQVKDIVRMQAQMIRVYRDAFRLFQRDTHFTSDEMFWMQTVYGGMIDQSMSELDRLKTFLVSFHLQASDAVRLHALREIRNDMETLLNDLTRFTSEQQSLSVLRGKDANDILQTKKLYGL